MKKKYSQFFLFIFLAWIFAFIFEEIPRTIISNIPGSQHLWELGAAWFPLLLVWYSVIFLIGYFIFINKSIKYSVIYGILYGLIFETFYFKKMANVVSFVLFVLLYFGMFYFPFKITKMVYQKEKIKKSEVWLVVITQLLALAILFMVRFAG